MTENLDSIQDQDINTGSADEKDAASLPPRKSGLNSVFSIPNYRFLLLGGIFAFGVQWIQQVILNWLVYDITASGTILGTVNIVLSIASLFMLLIVGILVDRFNRGMLMLAASGCMFIISAGLGLLLIAGYGNIALLFIFAFFAGIAQPLDMTLRQVLIFDFVPRMLTPSAVAINQTIWAVMRVIGPSLGGFFIVWFGGGGSFLAMSSVYIFIAITVFFMKFPKRKTEAVQGSPINNIREGLSYLIKEPVTRTFTLIGIILPILAIPIFTILPPIYAAEVFGDGSGKTLGFLMASVGVGGVFGGIVTASLKKFEYRGRLQIFSVLLLSVSLIAFALSTSLPLAIFFLAIAGFFEIIFLTTNMTLIQLSIPDRIRGRVTAVVNLTWVLSPIGSMMAGVGSDLLGGPKMITIIMSSIAAGIGILILIYSPTVRNYHLSRAIAASQSRDIADSEER